MSKTIWNIIIITILVYYVQVLYDMWVRPVVLTKNGWIRGIQSPDGEFNMFLGIPYAIVREDNPFGPSIPYPRFNDTFDASDDTKICPQVEEVLQRPVGTLQCLNLNIYIPKNPNKLPVLLFLYGGEYRMGHAGSIGQLQINKPDYLIKHDIIVVEFNYRVGVYGFLCLDRPDIPGNQGLKDQSLALRWVKDNIAEFGGDPEKITVSGHSSGAMSVDFHVYANPELFQQVILQSGTALIPRSVEVNTIIPFEVAKRLGYETSDLNEALDFIKNTNVLSVAEVSKNITFRPCIEKRFTGVEAFIKEHPINMIPNVRNKNLMIGNAIDEFVSKTYLQDSLLDSDELFKVNLEFDFNINDKRIIDEVVRFYIGDNVVSKKFRKESLDFYNDVNFHYPTHYVIDKYLENKANKIFYYIFNYTGDMNLMKIMKNVTDDTAVHADELGYLYKFSFLNKKVNRNDQMMMNRMTTMWANFVKFGDPTVEKSELLPVKWLPTSKNNKQCLVIDSDLKMDNTILQDRLAFWYNFHKKYERFHKYKVTNT